MLMFSWKKLLISSCLVFSLVAGMVFVFRFYSDKNEGANVSKNADTSLVPQAQSDSGNGKVFSRSEMRAIIEGFGEPSEEDIKVFQKDERYHGFLKMLEPLEGSISKETKNALIQNSYSLWFRQERLNEKEESGEIDMDGFIFGLSIIIELSDNFERDRLSDEQYMALMGVAKGELLSPLSQFSESTNGYSKITSLFPAIRNGEHPEIRSAEDLYRVVPKEAIEKIIVGSRERLRIQREAVRAFRLEKISEEEYEKRVEASTQAMRDAINDAVTPEQEVFLFGYEF